jgi:two-component system chemotaxis response regulator CheB
MPKMNGLEFLEALNKNRLKQKVVVVSTVAKEGAKETIRCLELGAFDFVTKPDSVLEAKGDTFKAKILRTICAACGIELAADFIEETKAAGKPTGTVYGKLEGNSMSIRSGKALRRPHVPKGPNSKKLVAIASSTGGPKALQQVIPKLPRNLNAPVVIVQHMPEGFTASLAQRLDETSMVNVVEASDGRVLEKGKVYIAKGGAQLRIEKGGAAFFISEKQEPARNGLKPCADIMYESLLNCDFDEITCVVLTGMGADGTLGINQLNEKKNIYVISQTEATSTVYGMPKVIAEVGLCDEIVPLDRVAETITKIVGVH